MAEYLHGAYGQVFVEGDPESEASQSAFVYVGTAPVHTVSGGAANLNKPVLVNNMADARKLFGYSDDWAKYTLCEAMHVHFDVLGVGPLVLINVLDPATHKASTQTTADKTPANGAIVITSAEDIILDTVEVWTKDSTPAKKVLGTDYTIAYNADKKEIVITSIDTGLGTAALAVKYYAIEADAVTSATVIGATDGLGTNTGLYAIKDVYQITHYIPAYLICPGFSSDPSVHAVMAEVTKKINKHWDAYMFTDLPITYNSSAVTVANAKTFKDTNGYTCNNETVSYPLVIGTDDNKYHLSVLRAAIFQQLLINSDGIPFRTASNNACALIKNLYTGEDDLGKVYDDEIINELLNKNGIASAAYVGGRWAIWGAHSAEYDQDNASYVNVAETATMMLYYISNDFQARRSIDVDAPMTMNDIRAIVAEEQARLDALVNAGALTFGVVEVNATESDLSDVINGDWVFQFRITTTPLAKSLTGVVTWTADGFATYFSAEE